MKNMTLCKIAAKLKGKETSSRRTFHIRQPDSAPIHPQVDCRRHQGQIYL